MRVNPNTILSRINSLSSSINQSDSTNRTTNDLSSTASYNIEERRFSGAKNGCQNITIAMRVNINEELGTVSIEDTTHHQTIHFDISSQRKSQSNTTYILTRNSENTGTIQIKNIFTMYGKTIKLTRTLNDARLDSHSLNADTTQYTPSNSSHSTTDSWKMLSLPSINIPKIPQVNFRDLLPTSRNGSQTHNTHRIRVVDYNEQLTLTINRITTTGIHFLSPEGTPYITEGEIKFPNGEHYVLDSEGEMTYPNGETVNATCKFNTNTNLYEISRNTADKDASSALDERQDSLSRPLKSARLSLSPHSTMPLQSEFSSIDTNSPINLTDFFESPI